MESVTSARSSSESPLQSTVGLSRNRVDMPLGEKHRLAALFRVFAFAPILHPFCPPPWAWRVKPGREPDSNRTKNVADLTRPKSDLCPWGCKVLGLNRTKMFHVKHFWNYSKLSFLAAKCDSNRTQPGGRLPRVPWSRRPSRLRSFGGNARRGSWIICGQALNFMVCSAELQALAGDDPLSPGRLAGRSGVCR